MRKWGGVEQRGGKLRWSEEKKEGLEISEGKTSHFMTSGYISWRGDWSLCILNQQMQNKIWRQHVKQKEIYYRQNEMKREEEDRGFNTKRETLCIHNSLNTLNFHVIVLAVLYVNCICRVKNVKLSSGCLKWQFSSFRQVYSGKVQISYMLTWI